jgi:hypothetical protein
MRHADIRTTMNIHGDATTADMREAHEKVVRLAAHGMNEFQWLSERLGDCNLGVGDGNWMYIHPGTKRPSRTRLARIVPLWSSLDCKLTFKCPFELRV